MVAGSSNNQVNPNFAAVRYNANGTLDASFATASMLSVDFFGFTDVAENVAIQPTARSCSAAWRATTSMDTAWRE